MINSKNLLAFLERQPLQKEVLLHDANAWIEDLENKNISRVSPRVRMRFFRICQDNNILNTNGDDMCLKAEIEELTSFLKAI